MADAPAGSATISKISWHIFPLIIVSYLIACIDRANIAFAAVQMNEDLGFTATIYGFGAGLFYLSYAMSEVPSNILLTRFGAKRWFARIMISWGVVAAGMMFVQTPTQFYIMRFLLGITEAGFFPGVIYYLTRWFPLAYRGRAISRFYMAGSLSYAVMGAISGWMLEMDGIWGLRGWQWLFLIQGLPAVVMAVLVFLFLPETPDSVRWLSEDEKAWLREEHAKDAARVGEPVKQHVWATLRHPTVWKLGMIGFLIMGSYYAFQLSVPILLTSVVGLDVKMTGYVVAIGGVLGALGMLVSGWLSDRRGDRFTFLIFGTLAGAASYLMFSLSSSPVVIIAIYLFFSAIWTTITLSIWMVSTDSLHPRLLAVGSAAINTIAQLGAFVGPWLWGIAKDQTGSYQTGLMVLTGVLGVVVVLIVLVKRQILGQSNRQDA